MKLPVLLILMSAILSCDSRRIEPDADKKGEHERLTQEEALERAEKVLLVREKSIPEKRKVIDHGDYYTVTPDLPPYQLGAIGASAWMLARGIS